MISYGNLRLPYAIQVSIRRDGKCITNLVLHRSIQGVFLIGIPSEEDVITIGNHTALAQNGYR